MSEDTPEALEPELRALFEAEARFPEAPADMRARVFARLPFDAPLPPVPDGTASAGKLPWLKAAALFVAGGVAGAGVHATLVEPPPPQVIQVPAPAPEPALPLPVVTPLPPPLEPRMAPDAPAARPAKKRERELPSEPAPSELARERSIIDAARTAMARGHADEALLTLARHAHDFPNGSLVEEREGLSVLALSRAGRSDEARAAAERFRARYPNSVLGAAIDAAVSRRP